MFFIVLIKYLDNPNVKYFNFKKLSYTFFCRGNRYMVSFAIRIPSYFIDSYKNDRETKQSRIRTSEASSQIPIATSLGFFTISIDRMVIFRFFGL